MTKQEAREFFGLRPYEKIDEDSVMKLLKSDEDVLKRTYLTTSRRKEIEKEIEALRALAGEQSNGTHQHL